MSVVILSDNFIRHPVTSCGRLLLPLYKDVADDELFYGYNILWQNHFILPQNDDKQALRLTEVQLFPLPFQSR